MYSVAVETKLAVKNWLSKKMLSSGKAADSKSRCPAVLCATN